MREDDMAHPMVDALEAARLAAEREGERTLRVILWITVGSLACVAGLLGLQLLV